METVLLSIPYFIISTQQHMDGVCQLHALTPFGRIDISVKRIDGGQPSPLADVWVQGDLGPWILDRRMPNAFRDAVFHLAGTIALSQNGCCLHRRSRLVVHFQNEDSHLTMTGFLPPPASGPQAEAEEPTGPHYYHWLHPGEKKPLPAAV